MKKIFSLIMLIGFYGVTCAMDSGIDPEEIALLKETLLLMHARSNRFCIERTLSDADVIEYFKNRDEICSSPEIPEVKKRRLNKLDDDIVSKLPSEENVLENF